MIQKIIYSVGVLFLLAGCQPPPSPSSAVESENIQASNQISNQTAVVLAQMQQLSLAQARVCPEASACTQYRIDIAHTNLDWLNEALLKRVKELQPTPFTKLVQENQPNSSFEQSNNNASSMVVRYLGQYENRASFVIELQDYQAKNQQGSFKQQYIHFDLNQKKPIHLADVLKTDMQAALIDALYEYNREWLAKHQIKPENLTLVDNFYFDPNGVVFVYSIDQFPSFSEDLAKLTLPYSVTEDLLHAHYLPSTWTFVLDE